VSALERERELKKGKPPAKPTTTEGSKGTKNEELQPTTY
jgi:hypothetical protein